MVDNIPSGTAPDGTRTAGARLQNPLHGMEWHILAATGNPGFSRKG
jgi:hypothetical protein